MLNIENATILGNSEHGVYATTPNVTVRNSIIFRNVWDVGGTPTLLNNCIGDGTSDGVDGNFAEDPLLRSPLFYLQEESPAIDAGDRTVEDAGLSGYTSLGDGTPDSGMVNLGFHYPTGLGIDAEVYVDPDTGLDTNDGLSWTTPFQSISRALEHPADRLRIRLAEGTYTAAHEPFPLTVEGRTVQLAGGDRDTTVIDAAGADARVLEVMNSLGDNRVEGVTLTGAHVDADGAGIHAWGSVLTVSNCRVSGNRAGIWNHCGGIFADGSIGQVRDSILQDNQMGSAHQNYGAGFYGLGGSWQVVNSVVSGNEGLAGGWNNTHGAGLNFSYGTHLLRNVLVAGNRVAKIGNGVGGIRVDGSCALNLESTTVVDNDPAGIHQINGRVTARNVVLFRNGTEYAGTIDVQYSCSSNLTHGVEGNITNSPLFVAGDDYHVLPNSPTLNAGLLQDWMVGATDLDGNKRVSMGAVDMGCYELPAPAGTMFMIR